MEALAFWKTITMDQTNFLERLIALLAEHGVSYRVIGGQAVNAYADPLVSLDLDLALAAGELERIEAILARSFEVKRIAHSLNVSAPGSSLRVQFQTDPRYTGFVEQAAPRNVLGMTLPVAGLEDVLHSKVWAAQGPERPSSKRQKDLTDIARLIEAHPHLRSRVPEDVLHR
jgi:hypothetical protein